MDFPAGLPRAFMNDVQIVNANSVATGGTWTVVRRRPGASMLSLFAVGAGGNGGNGVVGANSTAAGGGGGASGSQTVVVMPWAVLGSVTELYCCVGYGNGPNTMVAVAPDTSVPLRVLLANGGNAGGNGAGATVGAAGTAGGAATASSMPLGWVFGTVLNGQAGAAGGSTGVGASVVYPGTGLYVTGGCGGGGLPAAAAVGANGGTIGTATGWYMAPVAVGGSSATTPPANGSNGFQQLPGSLLGMGGLGGGSSHGSASGAGLVGGLGGAGGYGCGGGGGGGALTGSTQGTGGRGGDSVVIVTQW